jgi:dipeptidyl-peptidase-3
VADVEGTLFDPLFEPLITNKSPGPDGDILRDSAGNYYAGVTMADLEGFAEKYPLNSRVVKECPRKGPCQVVEQVYRAGTKDAQGKYTVPPGLYASQLEEICANLEKAATYAAPGQRTYFEHLVAFFRSGDPAAFDQASIAWLEQDPTVDAIIGFIESYKDPRSQKAEYEGLVYFKDAVTSELMQAIARSAGYFEKNAPWDDKYKKDDVKVPVAAAINVLAGFGGAGPNIPAGINLPNAQWIREKHGSRSVLLTNVMAAARAAVADSALTEFALPEEVALTRAHREEVSRAMVALHEVVGHGSGKASPQLTGDPSSYLKETYATLEEARAELVALHNIYDPRMIEIKALSSPAAAQIAYQDYLRGDLLQLRRIKKGTRIEDDHMRATHLIVQWILRNSTGGEVRKTAGKTYYVLKDVAAARKAVADLLSEIMRIKAEGDLDAARKLVDAYAVEIDPTLRDEVVTRADAAGVPDFVAFHVPSLRLVLNEQGETVDVVLDYNRDFVTAMLEMDLGVR